MRAQNNGNGLGSFHGHGSRISGGRGFWESVGREVSITGNALVVRYDAVS